ncbi:MAG: threonylcarbamoyl-AMP synthase [Marinilabiliales bacterium]|nr:MAG: threonylcarbamoyl-AMP synthase [Marinilabiliales bacterium]
MKEEINRALEILINGGIILMPTDSIWGLACDATNQEAIEKIYAIKKKTDHKAMLILLSNANRLYQYIKDIPDIAWELIDNSVKPLTIIYPNAKNLPESIMGTDKSIGIRIVDEPFCNQLLERFKKPIVSTSANISGVNFPPTFAHISDQIKKQADYIVDYKQNITDEGKPSEIIKLEKDGSIKILRKA